MIFLKEAAAAVMMTFLHRDRSVKHFSLSLGFDLKFSRSNKAFDRLLQFSLSKGSKKGSVPLLLLVPCPRRTAFVVSIVGAVVTRIERSDS